MSIHDGKIERAFARGVAGLLLLMWSIAGAHDLDVFATVEDGVLHGYAFFGGGKRARAAQLIIHDGAGNEMFRGGTDVNGAFYFRPTVPTDLVVTVDVGDGHAAKTRIPAKRFEAGEVLAAVGGAKAEAGVQRVARNGASNDTQLSRMIERSVDRAVARQITPLLETYATAQSRLRLNDIVSGVALIIGLAGMSLWARSRPRRSHRARDAP